MKSRTNTYGLLSALGSAVLWALFPVLTVMSYSALPVLIATFLSTIFSTCFFALVLTFKREWTLGIPKSAIRDIALACLFLGVLYYGFIFIGIRFTTAGNAAIIFQNEILTSYFIISILLGREEFRAAHAVGALFMMAGALIILLPKASGWHAGDLIIFAGSFFPPLGNLAMQRARMHVSASYIMFWRSLAGALVFLCLALLFGEEFSGAAVWRTLPVLLVNGLVLLGFSKILWIEAIHRIPITQTISLCAIIPLFTMLFAYVLLGDTPTLIQFSAFVPMAIGMWLLTRSRKEASVGS